MLKELYLLWLRLAAPQDLHYINGADTLPPPLPPEQERAALDALTRGQPQARDLLITHNLRLVVYIAKKFETPTAGIEDMISIALSGLSRQSTHSSRRKTSSWQPTPADVLKTRF